MRRLRLKFDHLMAKLDEALSARKRSEQLLFMLVAAALPLYVTFEFLAPAASAYQSQSQSELERITRQLSQYRLDGAQDDLGHLEAEIGQLRAAHEQERLLEQYIQAKILGLKHLHFTPQQWAAHLDWLSQQAQRLQVDLDRFENRIVPAEQGFWPAMAVELKGEGGFDRVMRYLYQLESGEKLSEIERLELAGGHRLRFEVRLALWGVQ